MKPADFVKAKDLLKSRPDNFYIALRFTDYIFDCTLSSYICPFRQGEECGISDTDKLTPRQLDNVKQLFPEQFI